MKWVRNILEDRRERKLIQAMITLAIEEQKIQRRHEEIIIARQKDFCWGDNCDDCRCDLAPDTQ